MTGGSSTGLGTSAGSERPEGGDSTGRTTDDEAITSLCGQKANGEEKFEFEIWVEIEGEKTPVYPTRQDSDSRLVAWIKSERGKHYTVTASVKQTAGVGSRQNPYPDMYRGCFIDGVWVGSMSADAELWTRREGLTCTFQGVRISPSEERKFQFAAPELTEAATSSIDASQVGSISIQFQRCRRGSQLQDPATKPIAATLAGPLNEAFKKTSLIGAVTAYGERLPVTGKLTMGTTFHPDDTKERPFFELLLHYAPEDILKAENIIPNVLRPNIAEGEPGRQVDKPIVLDDSDDEDFGPASVRHDPRAEEAAGASRLALAEIQAPVQARRREREEQERRDQELIDRAAAGNLMSREELERLATKRSASPVARVKTEGPNATKRCKVAVKEEEVDGVVLVTIKDD